MTPSEQQKLNKQLVKAAMSDDIGRLERLLAEGAQIDEPVHIWRYGTLTALEASAIKAKTDAAKVLLSHGADINRQNGSGETALMVALRHGWSGYPEWLLDQGARTDILNKSGQRALDVSIAAENSSGSEKVRARMRWEELTGVKAIPAPAPEPVPLPVVTPAPVQTPVAPKQDPDIVIFNQQAGDRVLQDIFNFVSHERITLVRKDVDGPVEAMTRQGFSEVESRDFLRRAFDEHLRRGGKTAEADIFPDVKPKITQIPGANA